MLSFTSKEYIFENEKPFESCHASTLVMLHSGDLLAAWFGGTKEGAGDVAIWSSKRTGAGWSTPIIIAYQEDTPHWNPVLFLGDDGEVFLYYKVGHTIRQWQTMVMSSRDNGNIWTKSIPLVKGDFGGRGPVKNKPIRLSDGTWLSPASIEDEAWDAFVDMSIDQGRTWIKSEMVPLVHSELKGKGVIQPTLWESEPGIVHMLLRSTEGCIYRSDSKDNGRTWCVAYPTQLPNNNSGIDMVRLSDGTLVLVHNPVGVNWGKRTPLVISASCDNGVTWEQKIVLEDMEGEFSYPAIVSECDKIYITYTWKRERIATVECTYSVDLTATK